jgi:hypothetical protein
MFTNFLLPFTLAFAPNPIDTSKPKNTPPPILLGDPMWSADAPALVHFDQVKVVKQPHSPAYPIGKSGERPQGDVLVEVWINEKGIPTNAGAVYGCISLAKAAVRYIYSWEFAPVLFDGIAQPARFRINVKYRHNNSNSPIEALPKELIYD